MTGETVRTQPGSVRIFCGYRRPSLSVADFRREVGQTFMPGTPYMLRPLGLHAYAGAIVDEHPSDTPHETGLIAYPSRAAYRTIRERNLRGRLYTHTHAGVYDDSPTPTGGRRSTAAWAEAFADTSDAGARTYHLLSGSTDLQTGVLGVHIGIPTDPNTAGERFRTAVRAGLPQLRERLRDGGFAQCFFVLRDGFYLAWTHRADQRTDVDPLDGWLPEDTTRTASLVCEPVLALEDPPLVTITEPAGFNFVFRRDQNAGLA
jgi:hypothetical protein